MKLAHIPFLQIEPTTRCNFTCGFCAGRSMAQIDMDFDYFCTLIDAVTGLRHVELQGEGEPLLHPRFFDMVSYINRQHPQARISFITNGSLFTDHNIQQILAQRIHRIFVSIESANPEEFQNIRGGKLQKVERGLGRFMEARNQISGTSPTVGLAVTILKSTAGHIDEIGALYQRLGLDGGIMLQPLQAMDCYTRYYTDAMRDEIPGRADLDKTRKIIVSDKALMRFATRSAELKGFYQELSGSVPEPNKTCMWLENGLYISAGGTACSCCFIKDAARDGWGRLEKNSVDKVLDLRRVLLDSLKARQIPGQCIGCTIAHNMERAETN